MEIEELKRVLSHGTGPSEWMGYPMTPEKGAALIVAELLADLPLERQEIIRDVIEDWAGDREDAACATTYESSAER